MAQLPSRLSRWLIASMAVSFQPVAVGLSLPYYVEGLDERTASIVEADHAEFRFTGPFITEIGPGNYKIGMLGNVLLSKLMGMESNAYSIVDWAGAFQNHMLDPLPVYKWGDGGDLLGCLTVDNKKENIKVYHFGQVSMTDRIRESEVNALYNMELTI